MGLIADTQGAVVVGKYNDETITGGCSWSGSEVAGPATKRTHSRSTMTGEW
jgi:hypothetical protein